jgi:hypothetical protein
MAQIGNAESVIVKIESQSDILVINNKYIKWLDDY